MCILRAMRFVACSGFPIPVSRYWTEFPAVEISDTEIGLPGGGTVRRWIRESPKGYGFAILAPKVLGESGFRKTNDNKTLVAELGDLAQKLSAQAVVFAAPPEFTADKSTRTAIRGFVGMLPDTIPKVVLDLPGWKPKDVAKACAKKPVVVAYDPLTDEPPPATELAYVRLPGPAGHRSRYDDAAIEQIATHVEGLDASTTFCVFRNIDMQANAHQLMARLGLE